MTKQRDTYNINTYGYIMEREYSMKKLDECDNENSDNRSDVFTEINNKKQGIKQFHKILINIKL